MRVFLHALILLNGKHECQAIFSWIGCFVDRRMPISPRGLSGLYSPAVPAGPYACGDLSEALGSGDQETIGGIYASAWLADVEEHFADDLKKGFPPANSSRFYNGLEPASFTKAKTKNKKIENTYYFDPRRPSAQVKYSDVSILKSVPSYGLTCLTIASSRAW